METSFLSWQIAIQVILALISFIGLFLSFNVALESKFNSFEIKINNLRTELKTDIEKLGDKVENLRVDQGKLEQRFEHLEATTNKLEQRFEHLEATTNKIGQRLEHLEQSLHRS
jgi:peptidoglycan hydrolase CwlO-like protein